MESESEVESEIGSECVGKQDVQPINTVNQHPKLHSFDFSSKSEFLWEIFESFIAGYRYIQERMRHGRDIAYGSKHKI